ncbi:MAG: macro domain-containing protein [Weissella confusa]
MGNVKFGDKRLRSHIWQLFTNFGTAASVLLIFFGVPDGTSLWMRSIGLLLILAVFFGIYVLLWKKAKSADSVLLKFGETEVDVSFGNIFDADANNLKVISFNEYFDTEVDGAPTIISSGTINGQYLIRNADKINEIEQIISSDSFLNEQMFIGQNINRRHGNKKQYRIGAVVELPDNYLAVAASKFTDTNNAYLSMPDYVAFLLTFWSEIDRIYNNRSIVIPVFGSGILRFPDGYQGAGDQDLLEIILTTIKISRLKISYPSRIKIVIFDDKSDKFNLYKLKELEHNGL